MISLTILWFGWRDLGLLPLEESSEEVCGWGYIKCVGGHVINDRNNVSLRMLLGMRYLHGTNIKVRAPRGRNMREMHVKYTVCPNMQFVSLEISVSVGQSSNQPL